MTGFLRVLFTPRCWVQNHRYSEAWDRRLNQLMAKHKFQQADRYTATLGGECIWIANHPYASFGTYNNFSMSGIRPRRITTLRAMDKYEQDIWGDETGSKRAEAATVTILRGPRK